MKRFYAVLLMISLLLPSSIFANSETEFPVNSLSTEDQALVDYLIANVSSADDVDTAIQAYFDSLPQPSGNTAVKMSTERPKKLNTVEIFSEEKPIGDNKMQGTKTSIIFYDNDTFVVETLSYEDEGEIEVPITKNIGTDAKLPTESGDSTMTVRESVVSGQNSHVSFDKKTHKFLWRTYMKVKFWYDQKNSGIAEEPFHTFHLGTNVDKYPYNVRYFYSGGITTVSRTQSFRKHPGNYIEDDDLRVACTREGFLLNMK